MAGYSAATNVPGSGRLLLTGVPEEWVLAKGTPRRVVILQATAHIVPQGMEVVVADYTGAVPVETLRRLAIHALLRKMKLA